jgi:tetratricopeptide (TPR) repeat protein
MSSRGLVALLVGGAISLSFAGAVRSDDQSLSKEASAWLSEVMELLESGDVEEAWRQSEAALEEWPEDPLLLNAASAVTADLNEYDLSIWYARLALDQIEADEERAELVAELHERVLDVDLVGAENEELRDRYDHFVGLLYKLAQGCARRKLYVNAVDLFLRCRGTRFEDRAEAELDRLYDHPKAATSILENGGDLPERPISQRKAQTLAARDSQFSTWENPYRRKTPHYTIVTDMGFEMLDAAATAMEQMHREYLRIFQFKGRTTRCTIRLYKSRQEFLEHEGDWAARFAGFYSPTENYVAAFDPRSRDNPRPLSAFWATLFHEASHQFTYESFPGLAPDWLDEGTASYFEGSRLLPNGFIEINGVAEGRLRNLHSALEQGEPTLREVISFYEPGSYPGSYYAVGWGLVYFMHNYEDERCALPYLRPYRDYFRTYLKDARHDHVDRFEEYFIRKPKLPGVTSFSDFEQRLQAWIGELHDNYFGQASKAEYWLDLGRRRLGFGRKEAALEAFRMALRKHPQHIAALVELADLLAKTGQKDAAILNYRKAMTGCLELSPDAGIAGLQSTATEVLQRCLARIARLDRTLSRGLSEAVDAMTTTVLEVSGAYYEGGFPRMALRLLGEATALMGGSPALRDLQSRILEDSKTDTRRWRRVKIDAKLSQFFYQDAWQVNGGWLSVDNEKDKALALRGKQLGAFEVAARVQCRGKPFGGIFFGSQSGAQQRFGVRWKPRLFTYDLYATDERIEFDVDLDKETVAEFDLRIDVRPPKVVFYLDEVPVKVREYQPQQLQGWVGVYGVEGTRFSNLRVKH